jgi:hypothetical protein
MDAQGSALFALSIRVSALSAAADVAGRSAEADSNSLETERTLTDMSREAANLLEGFEATAALEAIPDPETSRHFKAALARWTDAVETIATAVEVRDVAEMRRAGRALQAGVDEMCRAVAALWRATGQAPNPANPFR